MALVLNAPIYGALLLFLPEVAFLNHMAITFVALVLAMGVVSALHPSPGPRELPQAEGFDLTPSVGARWAGVAVVGATVCLYIVFW